MPFMNIDMREYMELWSEILDRVPVKGHGMALMEIKPF